MNFVRGLLCSRAGRSAQQGIGKEEACDHVEKRRVVRLAVPFV